MGKRLILGPILIAALILGAVVDQRIQGASYPSDPSRAGWIIAPLMLLLAVLAACELRAMLALKGVPIPSPILACAAAAGVLTSGRFLVRWIEVDSLALACTSAALVALLPLFDHARRRATDGAIASLGGTLLAFVYPGLMFGFLLAIRSQHSAWVLLWVILTTKACDIGAYFTGKAVGRHKLIPWLSPGKTWEGLIGGIAFAAVVGAAGAWALHHWAGMRVPPYALAAAAGAVFALVGQAGDLAESLLKRDAGIKDSGSTIPGMGGVLDVIDSPVFVAPVAFWILREFAARGWLEPTVI